MRKIILLSSVAIMSLLTANACILGHNTGLGPGGSIFMETTHGVSGNDLSNTRDLRKAEMCSQRFFVSLFGIPIGYAWGEGSVSDVAERGRINRIHAVDKHTYSILGIYSKLCTVIHGTEVDSVPGS